MNTPGESVVEPTDDEPQDDAAATTGEAPALASRARPLNSECPEFGPAFALLAALAGDQVPLGTLDHTTVPTAALMPAVKAAKEVLLKHGQRCQDPHCKALPSPLLPFSRAREAGLQRAEGLIYRCLWTQRDHRFVETVRERVKSRDATLLEQLSTGDLLDPGRLLEFLRGAPSNAQRLACLLWARDFNSPNDEALFRGLVPLILQHGHGRFDPPDATAVAKISDLEKELRKATKANAELKKRLASTGEEFTKLTRVANGARTSQRAAESQCLELRQRVEQLEKIKHELEADIASEWRTLEEQQRNLNILEHARREWTLEANALRAANGDLAQEAAEERRRAEKARRELEYSPRGAEAMSLFLDEEEERLQTELLITAGGARQRTEAARSAHRKLRQAFLAAYPEFKLPPPVRVREKTAVRFVPLGGSNEIGRSCYLLEFGTQRLLIDCGIKANEREDMTPDIDGLERVDALLLTHAHTDHIGWLPALIRKFPHLDIYCSEATAALLPVMLEDGHRHYMRRMARVAMVARHSASAKAEPERYDASDVLRVSRRVISYPFEQPEVLPGNVEICFFRAGHILGAASIRIRDDSGRSVFVSGDFSSFDQLTVPAALWPENEEVDLLILESTYGCRTHAPLADERQKLVSFVDRTVSAGGSIILASFALGRAQEILRIVLAARANGIIPDVPVYVDGMIQKINPIYRKRAVFDVSPTDYVEVTGDLERDAIIASAEINPSVIVTTSGMMTGGPVIQYARYLLPNPKHRIVLTGYQDEGAPTRPLRELSAPGRSSRRVTLTGEDGNPISFDTPHPAYEVKLSSHADQPGLLAYARKLHPRTIVLVHGTEESQRELRARLELQQPGVEVHSGPTEFALP